MAASPVSNLSIPVSILRRRPLAVTQRRLAANRRNAARSTGPRTAEGKAKVARNPIKHGFFAGPEKWTPQQQRDFAEVLEGLRDDFQPQDQIEESCIVAMAESYIRMAAMLRYENIAALKYHEQCDRELNERIAVADASEATRIEAQRENLRRAGLWKPTIPGPRETKAIIRYSGRLDRTIRRALSELEGLKAVRFGASPTKPKVQKQSHFEAPPRSGLEARRRTSNGTARVDEVQKQTHFEASPRCVLRLGEGPQAPPSFEAESEKANPLSSTFTGNRHERRRAKALAAKRNRRPNP